MSSLILGWKVDSNWAPEYWVNASAVAGKQPRTALVSVPARDAASHAVIAAQSGSGKSFFLGRLVEELLLRTRSRCVILDPNADFRRVFEAQPESLWTQAKYREGSGDNKLPHESHKSVFVAKWSRVPIAIHCAGGGASPYQRKLEFWWPSISPNFLAEDLDFRLRTEIYHYHEFTRALIDVLHLQSTSSDFFGQAQLVSNAARSLSDDDLRAFVQSQFSPKAIVHSGRARDASLQLVQVEEKVERLKQKALAVPKHVSLEIQRFYLSKAREYESAGILGREPPTTERGRAPRLSVIDLPSLPDPGTRLLAIHAVVAAIWQRARTEWEDALRKAPEQDTRVPTFVVLDEAHNIVPVEPRGGAQLMLKEQFRMLAAEGRKYGLFLILASQRPDRLDPMIVSECENRAIMRLNSAGVITETMRLLSVARKNRDAIKDLTPGRVLLYGRWGLPKGLRLYCAARRTVEGGRNLRSQYWARPNVGSSEP